ncbi:hypothetical protein Mal15_43720 [Stieleria maiorica]|uniref:Squalene--hopene cyclase n=1 Tax=Stieleria maiorica TaxID=2795974 RepID=A0A5B9MGC0_9BACT|nr:squalene--hopene cyclase [Stieleria maiorica]QEG00302.1 hypothetical protein Mal15_43720 [Stieleria maiorica]
MVTKILSFAFLCVACLLTSVVAADSPSATVDAGKPIAQDKAIDYLKREGQRWIDKQGCVSCHQIPAMLWSLHAAQSRGLGESERPGVPDQDLKRWTQWSTDAVNFVKPHQRKDVDVEKTLAGNIDTMAALMLAIPDDAETSWRDQFAAKLCSEQADDGSWKACGQLPAQKRPKLETAQATTLWVTLALLRHGSEAFDLASAIRFADSGPEAVSTEWYAVRMMVAAEQDPESTDGFRDKLLSRQRSDGGWGWITSESSDALATGLALYALAESGETESREITHARRFLRDSQGPLGEWQVPGTKASAKGKPTPTSTYWGTAWALVGLLSTRS